MGEPSAARSSSDIATTTTHRSALRAVGPLDTLLQDLVLFVPIEKHGVAIILAVVRKPIVLEFDSILQSISKAKQCLVYFLSKIPVNKSSSALSAQC